MAGESISSILRDAVRSFRFFAHKFFLYFDIFRFFQRGAVTRQVAIGNLEQVFHFGEINPVVHHQNGHNSQSDTAFEFFIKLIDVDHD